MARIKSAWTFGLGALTAIAGCGDRGTRTSVADASARVALAAAAISGQEAILANEVAQTSYLGFDTGTYPGDDAMRAWRTGNSPYSWAGYYLKSPCHQDPGWMGKRETLTAMDYGLAVLYVGQQTWGRRPGVPHMERVNVQKRVTSYVGHGKKRRKVTRTVTRTVLRKAPPPAVTRRATRLRERRARHARGSRRGTDDGPRGLPAGTTIFLDLERMDVLHQPMRDYYSAWVRAVLDDGRYVPGIYVHTYNANTVYSDVKAVYTSVGPQGRAAVLGREVEGFDTNKHPTEAGHTFASCGRECSTSRRTWNGHKIPIDVNVASLPSPSAVVGEVAEAFRGGE
jgi:hypothetical protein